MTNMKSTKKALITSALCLLLCVSMLVGATFAWFTDNVTSANNIIKSGNLDVELYHSNKADNGEKVGNTTELFDDIDLWEPGAVVYENLTVANEGSLALKYQLQLNFTNATETAQGSGKTLADVLKVAVVAGGFNGTRDEAKNLAYNYSLSTFALNGKLEAGTNDVYGIVIYWAPTANDNDYNVAGGLSIDLGVNLYATQLTSEEDSFNENYDGAANWLGGVDTDWYDASANELTIINAEQLAGFAKLVNEGNNFSGKTVKLASDINLANLPWTPIGTSSTNFFKGTFDGQGYTVYNLQKNAIEESYIGLFGYVRGGSVKNVNVHNVKLTGYSFVGSVVGRVYTGSIDNCHVTGTVELVSEYAYAGGIVGGDYVNITNCSVLAEGMGSITINDKTGAGGICGWHTEGPYMMSNCHVKNLNITAYTNLGGITGFVHYENTITGCSVENVTLTKTRVDGHPGIGMAAGGWSYNASKSITITNNTFKNITFNGNYVAVASADLLHGSEYSGTLTKNFVLDNNVTENITNNMVEVNRLTDGIVEKNGVKQIYNANGLKSLSETRISGNYELVADIDLGGAEIKAMIVNRSDSATFNGNGHTISNAKVVSGADDNSTEQASVFYVYSGATLNVSDLTLKDITVATQNVDFGYAAAVVGYCEGNLVLNNVDVVNANITGSKSSGMLVGHLSGSLTATDCDVNGTITISSFEADGHYAGEYVGTIAGNTTLTSCTANVTLGGNLKSSNVGTIYGRKVSGVLTVNGTNTVVVNSKDSLQSALDAATSGTTNIVLGADITGDVTVTQKPDVKITIDGNGNTFAGVITVDGKSDRYETAGLTIQNVNFNADAISADAYIRLGHVDAARYTNNVTVKGCTFSGNGIVAVKSYTGGDWNVTIDGCTVNAGMHSLAQFANVEKNLTITNCVVNSKNGANLNNTPSLVMSGCTFNVQGYAVRLGVNGNTNNGTFKITDCALTSACAEAGDAVIILRGDMAGATLDLTGTTLVGTPDIIGR